eukprot:scaffold1280_cov379-Prasinococcus_capsulatus_cf.AAC.23
MALRIWSHSDPPQRRATCACPRTGHQWYRPVPLSCRPVVRPGSRDPVLCYVWLRAAAGLEDADTHW